MLSKTLQILTFLLISTQSMANRDFFFKNHRLIAIDGISAKKLGLKPIKTIKFENNSRSVVLTKVSSLQLARIIKNAHNRGKCGSFQLIENMQELENYQITPQRNAMFPKWSSRANPITADKPLEDALKIVSATQIESHLGKITAIPTRYHRSSTANEIVRVLKEVVGSMAFPQKITVEEISHSRTTQKSLRIRLVGSEKPQEKVIIGGHLDSIAWMGISPKAPGADDNGSGVASLVELLRVISVEKLQFKRTLEFFFYAAEEVGLVGSAEIAKTYAQNSEDVVSVMQLDMTMYAGSGFGRIGSTSDFTTKPLNDYIKELNKIYTKLTIEDNECGYACSDHASWFKEGFVSTFPFEVTNDNVMNPDIHTPKDTMGNLNFRHGAEIVKLALSYLHHVANSSVRF